MDTTSEIRKSSAMSMAASALISTFILLGIVQNWPSSIFDFGHVLLVLFLIPLLSVFMVTALWNLLVFETTNDPERKLAKQKQALADLGYSESSSVTVYEFGVTHATTLSKQFHFIYMGQAYHFASVPELNRPFPQGVRFTVRYDIRTDIVLVYDLLKSPNRAWTIFHKWSV